MTPNTPPPSSPKTVSKAVPNHFPASKRGVKITPPPPPFAAKNASHSLLGWPISLFFSLLIILLFGLFLTRKFSLQVYEQKKQLALLKVQNERLSRLPQEIQSWQEEIDLIEEFFPGKTEMITFFDFLEKISPPQDFNFQFLSQQAETGSQNQPFLRFHLSVSGSWPDQLAPFLSSLFEGPYFIFPDNVSLENTGSIFQEAKLSLSGRIYVNQELSGKQTP